MVTQKRIFDLFNNYDVVQARQCARQMAREMGFSLTDQTRIATAVSELARQTLKRQGQGKFVFAIVMEGARRGLECTCSCGGWSQANSAFSNDAILGGVRRLMDEFQLQPRNGNEVAVVMRKWLE